MVFLKTLLTKKDKMLVDGKQNIRTILRCKNRTCPNVAKINSATCITGNVQLHIKISHAEILHKLVVMVTEETKDTNFPSQLQQITWPLKLLEI